MINIALRGLLVVEALQSMVVSIALCRSSIFASRRHYAGRVHSSLDLECIWFIVSGRCGPVWIGRVRLGTSTVDCCSHGLHPVSGLQSFLCFSIHQEENLIWVMACKLIAWTALVGPLLRKQSGL